MAGNQHAELVHARHDLGADDPSRRLQRPATALEFERREHRVVAGVIHEHDGRAVLEPGALTQRQVVRDRKHLVVRHQQALEPARGGEPAARVGRAAGPVQVDGTAARPVPVRAGGLLRFGRADREFRGLHQLVHEAVDRPGVDELVRALRPVGRLRVALGDLDQADAKRLGERRPAGLVGRSLGVPLRGPRRGRAAPASRSARRARDSRRGRRRRSARRASAAGRA